MYQDRLTFKTLKTYHRHDVAYSVICNGRIHYRSRLLGGGRIYMSKCPTTCPNHRTYAYEKTT